MAKRQVEWAKRTLARLKSALAEQQGGYYCSACGALPDLTFDCIHPTGHTTTKTGKGIIARATHYRQQFARRNLQLLCGKCNATKGDSDGVQIEFGRRETIEMDTQDHDNIPF